MVRLTGMEAGLPAAAGNPFFAFAHRACCASAIFRREAADMTRVGWVPFPDLAPPFNDSITEIAWANFSTCD